VDEQDRQDRKSGAGDPADAPQASASGGKPGETPQSFLKTRWSLVQRAAEVDGEIRREALGQLLRRYLPALQAYLVRRKAMAADEADDLLQGFVADKILQGDLLASADSRRGKFRSLLLVALDRYLVSQQRYEKAQKRSPGGIMSLDAHNRRDLAVDPSPPPDPFDAAWACEVLQQAICRMQRECQACQRPDIWGVFDARLARPAITGQDPMPYGELVARYNLSTPRQASNVLGTAKRMFARILRSAIAEYTPEDEIEEEIQQLRQALSRANLQEVPR
jgi:hypothetical protein